MSEVRKCRYCGKEFSIKMRECPFCGGENTRKVTVENPICPVCNKELKKETYRDVELDICPNCSGIWLDAGDFKILTSERDTYKDEDIPREVYLKKPIEPKVQYKKCVRCGRIMNRKMYKKISGVIIDICRDHGVWLDSGELEKVRIFIANGGLEEYQEHMDRMIEKNRRSIEKLAGRTNRVEFIQQMMHLYHPKYWFWKLFG